MKLNDIVVGRKYTNPTEKYGGSRVVDAIFSRRNGQIAVVWVNALSRQASQGHSHGVSTLATFARWARSSEEMSNDEFEAHQCRAAQRTADIARHGPAVDAFLNKCSL